MAAPQEALSAALDKDLVDVELQVVEGNHGLQQIVLGQRADDIHLLLQYHLTDGPADLLDAHLTLLALLKLAAHHLHTHKGDGQIASLVSIPANVASH